MNAGGSPGTPPTSSVRSTSEARIEAAWGWVSRTAGGPSKRIADGSMRAPSKAAGASLRWIFRGPRFPPSRAYSHLARVSWQSDVFKMQQTGAAGDFTMVRGQCSVSVSASPYEAQPGRHLETLVRRRTIPSFRLSGSIR